jgi:hypothetical protein
MISPNDVTVFIDPISHHYLRNELFHPNSPHNRDNCLAANLYVREILQSKGIEVHTADFLIRNEKVNKFNVYFSLGTVQNYKRLAKRKDTILSTFFTLEAPIVKASMYKNLPEISRNFRRVYSQSPSEALKPFMGGDVKLSRFHYPQPNEHICEELWSTNNRKFLTMITVNKLPRCHYQELWTERLKAVEYFSRTGEIDLYGFGWDDSPYRVGETWVPTHLTRLYRLARKSLPLIPLYPYHEVIKKVYKGPVESKYATLSKYTFAICYENMILQGWFNEKMFDCFLAGTIPIYLGDPDVTNYVPENCFIDKRNFSTYEALRAYMRTLSEKDIQAYKENARDYLSCEMFKPFRKKSFAEIFIRAVEEDVGIRI